MVTYLLSFNNMFLIIAGHPATGKTTLGLKLKQIYPDHTLIHTDAYMEHGYKESLYMLLQDLESYAFENIIVEGIMGARLMRKLQELHPEARVDLYVFLRGNMELIAGIYARERPDKNIKDIESTCKGLDTVDASIDKSTLSALTIILGDTLDNDSFQSITTRL